MMNLQLARRWLLPTSLWMGIRGFRESKRKMNRTHLWFVYLICVASLALCANGESPSDLAEHTLDIRSRIYDVAISPDDRRIAIVAVKVSGNGNDSSERKFIEQVEIWEWEFGKVSSRKALYEAPYVRGECE